jgi:selenocysteine-specific translation elongation factor
LVNYIISVPLDVTLAEFIGKRGSVNGITFYNRKINDDNIVAIAPSSIQEKFYSLATSMLVADQIIVSTSLIDRYLGEVLVAGSLLNKRMLITDNNSISNLLSNVKISNFEIVNASNLLDKIIEYKNEGKENENVVIDVDKAFPVKGVGTVILGIVRSGIVKVHDKLYHPDGKEILIRSIQSQDIDIASAGRNTRVGLAIKGMEYDEIEKGDVLSTKPIKKVRKFISSVKVSQLANNEIQIGKRYGIATNMSFVEGVVENIENNNIVIITEKAICIDINDTVLFLRNNLPKIFAVGVVISIEK